MVGLGPTRAGTSQPARTIACSASRYGTICDFGGPGPTPRTWMLPGPGVSKPGSRCDTRSASNRSHDAWRRNVSDQAVPVDPTGQVRFAVWCEEGALRRSIGPGDRQTDVARRSDRVGRGLVGVVEEVEDL